MKQTFILALLLAGCAFGRSAENVPLDPVSIEKLKPGKTTSKEVVELMGAPVDVVQLGFKSAYVYRHTYEKSTAVILVVANAFRQDHRQDRLWVFFDEKGVLTHYGATLEARDTKTGWPFNNVYKKGRDYKPLPGTEASGAAKPQGDAAKTKSTKKSEPKQ